MRDYVILRFLISLANVMNIEWSLNNWLIIQQIKLCNVIFEEQKWARIHVQVTVTKIVHS